MENKVNRRNFIQLVSASTILAATGSPLVSFASKSEKVETGKITFLSKPYLQNPEPTAISVFWLTNRPCYSWVEISAVNESPIKVHSTTNGLVDANNRIHKIIIENLRPSTAYTYKVFSKDIILYEPYKLVYGDVIESDTYHFTTWEKDADSVSLLILNDIHDHPESFPLLMQLNGDQPYDFVFLNGDMFDFQKDENQLIEHLLQPCAEAFSTGKPFLFVRGNHETRGIFSRNLADYFENINKSNYFSFTQGPVYFIALDTGEDKEDSDREYGGLSDFDGYREEQAIWLEQQLKSQAFKKAKFKVVLMHIPHYHSGEWHGTVHCRKLFGPLFNKHKIDMLISGHTHVYGVHKPQEGHNFPIIIGGGPNPSGRTIMRLTANQKTMNLVMTRDTGEVVGKYTVSK
ncbi:putative purple acid phosphatase [Arcticibacter svalbardensis MN12-7]|uniref:Putative purple acid phosphatase n=1 Tax=Arcticibacter svalbardensis MN12-7 TaxID=1150600 RepID=R9GRH1_9SPHI|nr:metallophosphoesterase family protein [Arcticibacter svalbardensis]EOR94316.1 putative purple acid phosphatase [Arcticibacter svalbardensis MN12-7]